MNKSEKHIHNCKCLAIIGCVIIWGCVVTMYKGVETLILGILGTAFQIGFYFHVKSEYKTEWYLK